MNSINEWLADLPGPAVYAVVALLVYVEDAFFIGVVLPAESVVVVGGAVSHTGAVSVHWLSALVVVAAVAGDFTGYEIGRRAGGRILGWRLLRERKQCVAAATELLNRRAGSAVFFGRFVAFVRTAVPALAGMAKMPYRRFARYNVIGALIWGVGFTLLGYFASDAYTRVERTVGKIAVLVLLGALLLALVLWRRHRRVSSRRVSSR